MRDDECTRHHKKLTFLVRLCGHLAIKVVLHSGTSENSLYPQPTTPTPPLHLSFLSPSLSPASLSQFVCLSLLSDYSLSLSLSLDLSLSLKTDQSKPLLDISETAM